MKTNKKKINIFTVILCFSVLVLLGGLIYDYYLESVKFELVEKESILKLDNTKEYEIIANKNQLIKITSDGIKAYDLKGVEKWSDTLTIKNIKLSQQEPYFAIADKNGKKIDVYNENGKKNSILTENPIIYFSINKNGDVAVIEDDGDSYIVSGYTGEGAAKMLQTVTYSKDLEFPMVAKISPDSKSLLISYIDLKQSIISSNIVSIPLSTPSEQSKYPIQYALVETDNLVYDLEFISDKKWVSIGDHFIHWYTSEGTLIQKVSNGEVAYYPQLNDFPKRESVALIENSPTQKPDAYNKGILKIYNNKGGLKAEKTFPNIIDFAIATSDEIILKANNTYYGLNYRGQVLFESESETPYRKIFVFSGNRYVGVKDDEVVLFDKKAKKKGA